MPTRRYYICTLPIEHINGKMDQVKNVVRNTPNPPAEPVDGFWYGYRPRWSNVSYYGIRREPRNLTTNPYTPAELEHRGLFTTALLAVKDAWVVTSKRTKCLNEWENTRTGYATARGYAIAETYANEGVWPDRWD